MGCKAEMWGVWEGMGQKGIRPPLEHLASLYGSFLGRRESERIFQGGAGQRLDADGE